MGVPRRKYNADGALFAKKCRESAFFGRKACAAGMALRERMCYTEKYREGLWPGTEKDPKGGRRRSKARNGRGSSAAFFVWQAPVKKGKAGESRRARVLPAAALQEEYAW